MKSLLFACCLGLALICATAFAADYTGYISDTHCGAKHMDGSQASIDCVTSCVKSGQPPVFVGMDKKIYKLSDASKVSALLGQKVTLTGTMKGDTVIVEKAVAAK
jgi:hypothetical protein